MLLDITVSPCSRVTMFLYMLMQIIARLLAFQVRLFTSGHDMQPWIIHHPLFKLFALYWGPGQLYPLVVFVIIHMFISAIMHVFFSEDLHYVRQVEFRKVYRLCNIVIFLEKENC